MKKLQLLTLLPLLTTTSLFAEPNPEPAQHSPGSNSAELAKALPQNPPLNRQKASELIRDAQTQAFYSEEVQTLVKNRATWQEITTKVESLAKTINPEAYKLLGNPFDSLTQEEKTIYSKAYSTAAQNPEITTIRKIITLLQEEIQKTMEKLTPGYEAVRNKLENNK